MGIVEIATAIAAVAQYYPLSFSDTIAMLAVLKLAVDALLKKQWAKAGEIILAESLELFEKVMDDKAKRQLVIAAVWSKLPAAMRAFMSEKQLGELVDLIYATKTKPLAKEQGLIKGSPQGND